MALESLLPVVVLILFFLFILFVVFVFVVFVLILLFFLVDGRLDFDRILAHNRKTGSTLFAGQVVAFIEFIFFGVDHAVADRTIHHIRLSSRYISDVVVFQTLAHHIVLRNQVAAG